MATTAVPKTKQAVATSLPLPAPQKMPSGPDWVEAFPGSRSTDDLAQPFGDRTAKFVAALRAAGAKVIISATLRPMQRTYLMHWCWMIAREAFDPASVPPLQGVDIEWNHGGDSASIAAAEKMVNAYGIVKEPSLHTKHGDGAAIDMTISWTGALQVTDAAGNVVSISTMPRSGMNIALIGIGATYGVIKAKFSNDPPHWSDDGH